MVAHAGDPGSIVYDEGEVFEIFQQDLKDPAPYHGGNLCAPDSELALHYAKEFYGRRQESQKLWIIPRSAMWEVSDLTHLASSLHELVKSNHPASSSHEFADSNVPPERQPFAIFAQKQAGKPLLWLKDLEEMNPQAVVQAIMGEIQTAAYLRLWLCPRSAIVELVDPNLLQPPLDRSYRRLDGYNIREKLRQARQRAKSKERDNVKESV